MGWRRIRRIVGFGCEAGWLFGRVVGFRASLLVGEVPSGVAFCELRSRFDQLKGKLIPLSTQHSQLGQLSMAVRVGLNNDANGCSSSKVETMHVHTRPLACARNAHTLCESCDNTNGPSTAHASLTAK
jgi:hypothetical protein